MASRRVARDLCRVSSRTSFMSRRHLTFTVRNVVVDVSTHVPMAAPKQGGRRIEGSTLAERLKYGGPLPVKVRVSLARGAPRSSTLPIEQAPSDPTITGDNNLPLS